MGNIIKITNAAGEHIATGNHGLACFALVSRVADQLGLGMMPFNPDQFNDWAKVFEKVASPEQWMIFRFFLSDDETFTEEDIPTLERAVAMACSDTFKNANPRMVLRKYLELLREHRSLTLKYQDVYSATMIVTGGK